MTDERTHNLVTAWRAADEHQTRVGHRWPRIRLVMWLLAAPAVALLVLGYSAVYPLALTLVGLAVAGEHALREMHADRTRNEAWTVLTEHARLNGLSLGLLLDDDSDAYTAGGDR